MALLRESKDGTGVFLGAIVGPKFAGDIVELMRKGYDKPNLEGTVLESYTLPSFDTSDMSTADQIIARNKMENLIDTCQNGLKFVASESIFEINNFLQQLNIITKEENPDLAEELNQMLIFIVPKKLLEDAYNQGKLVSLEEQEFEGGDAYLESMFIGIELIKDIMKEVGKNKRDNYSKVAYCGSIDGKDYLHATYSVLQDLFGRRSLDVDKYTLSTDPINTLEDVNKYRKQEVLDDAGRSAYHKSREHEPNED